MTRIASVRFSRCDEHGIELLGEPADHRPLPHLGLGHERRRPPRVDRIDIEPRHVIADDECPASTRAPSLWTTTRIPQIRSILIDQRRVISARRAGDTCEKRSATIAIPRNR
jgi:hypothetical protein